MAKRKTHKDFIKEVYEKVKCDYSVLSLYKNNKEKVLIKHNQCGNIYEVSPNKFLHLGRRCPKCNGGVSYNNKVFLEKVSKLTNDYIFLEEYKNNDTHLKCKHEKCGHVWEITPHHFLAGVRCPKCANNIKKTQNEFVKEVHLKRGNSYKVIGTYKNNMTPIEILHEECGNSWNVIPVKFLAGRSCPYCVDRNNSKNVIIIKDWLNKNSIDFEVEKSFDDCKYKDLLFFDFYIPSLKLLLEYDGEFHFKPYSNHQKSLEDTKKRDSIKNDYVKNKEGYTLYRITYKDNIEKELEKIFR